ncbi:dlec1 deleted in lung and esophageal cancer 1 [Holotrichia oblita]|uniref:Dlec1 deleted in lung and esophageal cancer 1 n=1 Tax=Holotrichia oblita TaxID=644536 RepID=A0ACB9TFS2_HOLOL|nr:dlec1 deleted in lung and esophageal cancer 1 [Holotrichia oblita]
MQPCSEKIVDITYVPLLPGVMDANLEVTTKELGIFLYHLYLEANNAEPEPPLVFKCAFGQCSKKKVYLENYSKAKSDFKIKILERNIFMVDHETNAIDKDTTGFLTVTFEPSALGNIQSTLTLCSPTIGQYIYPLIGTCTYPTPQGPIVIQLGTSTTFTFKNPFEEEMEFQLKVQPEVFQIKSTVETVPAKKNMKIVVSTSNIKSDTVNNKPIPFTGKVTIKCTKCNIPNLKWVYYLQTECHRNI